MPKACTFKNIVNKLMPVPNNVGSINTLHAIADHIPISTCLDKEAKSTAKRATDSIFKVENLKLTTFLDNAGAKVTCNTNTAAAHTNNVGSIKFKATIDPLDTIKHLTEMPNFYILSHAPSVGAYHRGSSSGHLSWLLPCIGGRNQAGASPRTIKTPTNQVSPLS